MTNRMVKLARRPRGLVSRDDFVIEDGPIPEPGPGQFRVRVQYLSLDPAMRGWMNEGRSYVPPVALSAVMRAYGAGTVEASNHPGFIAGEAVTGVFGVQRYALSSGELVSKADLRLAPLPRWLGGLGMPGLTAYLGLLDVGQPKAGETVVISAATGAVGSVVGQIARLKGCRAVGVAGGPEKCRFAIEELGFDACVDHKAEHLSRALKAACPAGIDVDFENVGGAVFDAVLAQMNRFGRIALCGLISGYNDAEAAPGPKNLRFVLTQRLRLQGFIVFDFAAARAAEATSQLAAWIAEGRLKLYEDVRPGGVDAFPDVLNELYRGGNLGKLVLEV